MEPVDDPAYRQAAIDLLGVRPTASSPPSAARADADLAPSLDAKAARGQARGGRVRAFRPAGERIEQLGGDPEAAMQPFVPASTPSTSAPQRGSWLEGVVKAYVGDSIAADFYREISAFLDEGTRDLVVAVLQDSGQAEFVVSTVRAAIGADHAGRPLALWARRFGG